MITVNKKWGNTFGIFFLFIIVLIFLAYFDKLPDTGDGINDFFGHFILYGLLGILAHRAIQRKHLLFFPLAILVVIAFTTIEEFIQLLSPNRNFNPLDIVANISGLLFFYFFDFLIFKIKSNEKIESDYKEYFTKIGSKGKTAIVFGGTGLVGAKLIKKLIKDDSYKEIRTFSRRELSITNPKINEIHSDVLNMNGQYDLIKGDDLFFCIGTTIKKAQSKENFNKVDYILPVRIAKIASDNKVANFIAISSLGSERYTNNFYLSTKRKMEQDVQQFKFEKTAFIKPSLLLGEREEFRFLEKVSKIFLKIAKPFLIGKSEKYKAINSEVVARAMIRIANTKSDKKYYESDELQIIGKD